MGPETFATWHILLLGIAGESGKVDVWVWYVDGHRKFCLVAADGQTDPYPLALHTIPHSGPSTDYGPWICLCIVGLGTTRTTVSL